MRVELIGACHIFFAMGLRFLHHAIQLGHDRVEFLMNLLIENAKLLNNLAVENSKACVDFLMESAEFFVYSTVLSHKPFVHGFQDDIGLISKNLCLCAKTAAFGFRIGIGDEE